MTELVHLTRGVCAEIVLDNPPMNVVTTELTVQLRSALRAIAADDEVRAVVVSGAGGRAFCAGSDIGEFASLHGRAAEGKLLLEKLVYRQLAQLPVPTVAAIEGHALGGGLELALCCDFRIAAEGIKLGMPPAKLGLVYSHTGLRKFVDAIGVTRTRELFFTGRNVSTATALEWGMVNEIVAPEKLPERAVAFAAEIAANAPLSLTGNKRIIRELLAADVRLAEDAERALIALRAASFASADMREGVRAFAEKRAPRWQGR